MCQIDETVLCVVCSELNDDVSEGIVDDVDGPLLLKAILAHDAHALQSSSYHLSSPAANSSE